MESRKTRFEDHVQTIESSHSKTASLNQKSKSGNDLLTKLAEELGLNTAASDAASAAAGAAPTAEGEVLPAASTIAAANPAVEAATDAVAMPQVTMAGGTPVVMEAGSAPNPQQIINPVISAADGNLMTAQDLNRTPEAVAEAAQPTAKGETEVEAEKIGRLIAKSFQETIEKAANDQEYSEALDMLKEAELLSGYNIKDSGMTKTASYDGFLEKIASNQPLTRDDIIGAAHELVEFNKQASLAEEQGREAAQNLVELMQKVAEEATEEKEEKTEEEEKAEDESKEEEASEKEAQLKIASLLSDPNVVNAIKTLKNKNLL